MRSQVLFALGCAACLALGAWAALALRDLRERMRGRALQRQGARGERDAERVLRAAGYAIRERQARRSYRLAVNGTLRNAEVAFDFVVERAGEQLVAEVKTGHAAPRVERAETRRQLLEYQLATGARCVLLVDPDAGTITEVAFPITLPERAPRGSWHASAVLVAMVVAAAWYLQHHR
jgi:hypothetical protein